LQLEELEGFFEINLDLLCIADKQANFLKLNKEWENLLGYTIAELLNTKYLKYVHPDDIEATHEQMSKLERNENVTNFVNRYICKNGDIKYIEWRCKPKDNLIYASARDVTQRILMENELTISEQKFRTLFELLPTGITIADTTGKLLQCNPAAEQIIGIICQRAFEKER
jgi:PAS domain S-box-containing protein